MGDWVGGIILLTGIGVLTFLYRRTKTEDPVEAGRNRGYLVVAVIVWLILISLSLRR